MSRFLSSWGLVVLSAICDSYAAYVVKHKFNAQGEMDWSSFAAIRAYLWHFVQSPLLLTAIVTFVAAPALWFFALNRLDLSVAYPVLVALHLVLVMLTGALLLGEDVNRFKIMGTILLLGSLVFFAMGNSKEKSKAPIHEDHSGTVVG
jgi:multidrug transporter EmrE-like cation transporter